MQLTPYLPWNPRCRFLPCHLLSYPAKHILETQAWIRPTRGERSGYLEAHRRLRSQGRAQVYAEHCAAWKHCRKVSGSPSVHTEQPTNELTTVHRPPNSKRSWQVKSPVPLPSSASMKWWCLTMVPLRRMLRLRMRVQVLRKMEGGKNRIQVTQIPTISWHTSCPISRRLQIYERTCFPCIQTFDRQDLCPA